MPDSLPSEAALYRLYDAYRELYFKEGQAYAIPPAADVTLQWSARLTASAGICYPRQRVIRLSPQYHVQHPDDVSATLLHEMIHLVVPGHGPQFYAWMERIQALGGHVARYAKTRATPQTTARWVYTCRDCGAEAKRQRRLKQGGRHHRHKGCGGTLAEQRL